MIIESNPLSRITGILLHNRAVEARESCSRQRPLGRRPCRCRRLTTGSLRWARVPASGRTNGARCWSCVVYVWAKMSVEPLGYGRSHGTLFDRDKIDFWKFIFHLHLHQTPREVSWLRVCSSGNIMKLTRWVIYFEVLVQSTFIHWMISSGLPKPTSPIYLLWKGGKVF